MKGQLETQPPEALTVKRAAPKTKKDRKGDCNSKGMSAEQMRLNPMAAMDAEESKGDKPLTAEQRRLMGMSASPSKDKKPMSAEQKRLMGMGPAAGHMKVAKGKVVGATTVEAAKTVAMLSRKNSIVKQDLEHHFKQKSFKDSREKIINLAKKSGLRQINALEVARDLRKLLRTQN